MKMNLNSKYSNNNAIRHPRFHEIGQTHVYTLLDIPEKGTPKWDYTNNRIARYVDGNIIMQWVYPLRMISEESCKNVDCESCALIRPRNDEDNEYRELRANSRIHNAIQSALQDVNEKDGFVITGGKLVIRYEKDEPSLNPTHQASKCYIAAFRNPMDNEEQEAEEFYTAIKAERLMAEEGITEEQIYPVTVRKLIPMSKDIEDLLN